MAISSVELVEASVSAGRAERRP